MKRTMFLVSWELEVEAESEIEAAEAAKKILQDNHSGLLNFFVESDQGEFGRRVSVNLNWDADETIESIEEV